MGQVGVMVSCGHETGRSEKRRCVRFSKKILTQLKVEVTPAEGILKYLCCFAQLANQTSITKQYLLLQVHNISFVFVFLIHALFYVTETKLRFLLNKEFLS